MKDKEPPAPPLPLPRPTGWQGQMNGKGTARPCRHCCNPVAIGVKRCPRCGGKRPSENQSLVHSVGCLILIAIVAIAAISNIVSNTSTNNSSSAQANGTINERPSSTMPHKANPFAPNETLIYDDLRAAKGHALYQGIVDKDPVLYQFYEEVPLTRDRILLRTDGWRNGVDRRNVSYGFAAVIFLPDYEWSRLDDSERELIGHFLSRESPHTGWVVYVGQVNRINTRRTIMGDSAPMSSRDWNWIPEPEIP